LGTATVDHDLAESYLKRMTFANYAKSFPDYWTGRWSASDSLDSSLLPKIKSATGAPSRLLSISPIVSCASNVSRSHS
jgi:hypothetical protein